jgi:DNA-binding Xre family transcriptional regulator
MESRAQFTVVVVRKSGRVFRNLCQIEGFTAHNFTDATGYLRRAKDSAIDLAGALRAAPYSPDPDLVSTLAVTLCPDTCAAFLKSHPDIPATPRDYYISKLYQFFLIPCLDDFEDFEPGELADALDTALPEGSPHLSRLGLLDWVALVMDYAKYSPLALAARIVEYLPGQRPKSRSRGGETPDQVIDRIRHARGWSMLKLSTESQVDPKQIYKIKNGQNVTGKTLARLAQTLQCSTDQLMWRR